MEIYALGEADYTVIAPADLAAELELLQAGIQGERRITDVGLPNDMGGRHVADAARSLRPGLKVFLITGHADNAAVGNVHPEPGMALLIRPFTPEAPTAKVAAILKDASRPSQLARRMTACNVSVACKDFALNPDSYNAEYSDASSRRLNIQQAVD